MLTHLADFFREGGFFMYINLVFFTVAVASIIDEPTSVSFDFDPGAYGLAAGGQIERIDERGRHRFGTFSTRVVPVTLELPAGGAYMLEFTGDRQR